MLAFTTPSEVMADIVVGNNVFFSLTCSFLLKGQKFKQREKRFIFLNPGVHHLLGKHGHCSPSAK